MRPGGREGVDNLRKGPPRGIVGMRGGRLMPAPGESADFPALIPPMLAVPARELPAPEAEWAAEFKWDGVRAVAYVSAGGLRLVSRNGRDMTRAYPELAELAGQAGERRMVLDGEIVVFARGRPSFAGLQRRMLAREPAPYLVAAFAVTYLVFDIMYLDGQQLAARPYADRRAILEALGLASGHVHVPPSFPGGGRAVRAVSIQQGLEGVVVKRLDSPYLPGRRSASWLKIKNRRVADVTVGGISPGQGERAGQIGSLLVGVPAGPGQPAIHHSSPGGPCPQCHLGAASARHRSHLRRMDTRRDPPRRGIPRDEGRPEPSRRGTVRACLSSLATASFPVRSGLA